MSGDGQIKSFIDRVLRLKEEQDEIGRDIREIYAEAKSMGFDKTQMGKVVAHLRKAEKIGADGMSEAEAIFDAYLSAYHRASGTAIATHTHEAVPHDPETGEILESVQSHDAAVVSEPAESSSDAISAEIAPEPVEALSEVALPTTDDDTDLSGSGRVSGTGSAGGEGSNPSGAPEPDGDAIGGVKAQGRLPDADSVEPSPSVTFDNPRCQSPDTCPNAHSRNSCHECLTAWAERPKDEQVRLWQEAIGAAA